MIVRIFFIGYEIFSLQYYDTEFSLWDRFELTRNEKGEEFTLQEFLDYFQVSKQTMQSNAWNMLGILKNIKKVLDSEAVTLNIQYPYPYEANAMNGWYQAWNSPIIFPRQWRQKLP